MSEFEATGRLGRGAAKDFIGGSELASDTAEAARVGVSDGETGIQDPRNR
jgi:hypothetical protein